MGKFILPECYADTAVIEVLGFNKPNHIQSIGQVINSLNKNYNGKLGIGFIDRDKARKGDAENTKYQTIKTAHNNTLILKQKPNTKNYLIEHPNIEKWLSEMANELGLEKTNYGVSDLLTNKKRYKSQSIGRDVHFRNFINALSQKQKSPLQTVKNWIDELNK